jgi:predicted GH43/DUF377 family glycosyl hydrolase
LGPGEVAVWAKHDGNPVLTAGPAGSWDAQGVASPSVLALSDTAYAMWFTGTDGMVAQIGFATSHDGVHWTKSAENPVLGPGAESSWDAQGVESPCVLFDGHEYVLFYSGRGQTGRAIGRAFSPDGMHWVRQPEPVLTPTPAPFWDDAEVYAPWVRWDGTSYEMWYTGRSFFRQVGYATSVDAQHWTKLLTPVIQAQVLEAVSFEPCVLASGSVLRIWYGARHEGPGGGAFPGVIDTAESIDGVVWGAQRTVLVPGPEDAWDADAVGAPCVLADAAGQRMWYEGWQGLVPGETTQGTSAIGLATFP